MVCPRKSKGDCEKTPAKKSLQPKDGQADNASHSYHLHQELEELLQENMNLKLKLKPLVEETLMTQQEINDRHHSLSALIKKDASLQEEVKEKSEQFIETKSQTSHQIQDLKQKIKIKKDKIQRNEEAKAKLLEKLHCLNQAICLACTAIDKQKQELECLRDSTTAMNKEMSDVDQDNHNLEQLLHKYEIEYKEIEDRLCQYKLLHKKMGSSFNTDEGKLGEVEAKVAQAEDCLRTLLEKREVLADKIKNAKEKSQWYQDANLCLKEKNTLLEASIKKQEDIKLCTNQTIDKDKYKLECLIGQVSTIKNKEVCCKLC